MPSRSTVHVDAPLTNLAIQYQNAAFIGDSVLPVVRVRFESDKYYVFGKERFQLNKAVTPRAPGEASRGITWDITTQSYSANEYSIHSVVPDRVVNNADAPVQVRINTTKILTDMLLAGTEQRIAKLVQNTNNVGNSAQPSTLWTNSSAAIESDIDTAKTTIRTAIGKEPTSVVYSYNVKQTIKKDSTLRNLLRYTVPNYELVKSGDLPPVLFNLEVLIGMAIYETANEGQTSSLGNIWSDNVLVFYKEAAPSLMALSLGYQFRVNDFGVKSWREEEKASEIIEVSTLQDEEVIAKYCGYIITSPLG